jgi:hypothetical protein
VLLHDAIPAAHLETPGQPTDRGDALRALRAGEWRSHEHEESRQDRVEW